MNDVTRILSAIEGGDGTAASQLLPLVYDELRKLAAQRVSWEGPGRTLGATALVHEAYVRLVGGGGARHWAGRGHFFAAAAEAMRRILVDEARRRHSRKRGRGVGRVELADLDAAAVPAATGDPGLAAAEKEEDLLALDEALAEFEAEDPVRARLV